MFLQTTDMCHRPTWHINVLMKRVILCSRYMYLISPGGEGDGGCVEQKWLPCAFSRLRFNICKGDCIFSRRRRDNIQLRLLWQNPEPLMRIRETQMPNLCVNVTLTTGKKQITCENCIVKCGIRLWRSTFEEANFLWFHEAFLISTCRKKKKELTHECICPNAHVNLNSVYLFDMVITAPLGLQHTTMQEPQMHCIHFQHLSPGSFLRCKAVTIPRQTPCICKLIWSHKQFWFWFHTSADIRVLLCLFVVTVLLVCQPRFNTFVKNISHLC